MSNIHYFRIAYKSRDTGLKSIAVEPALSSMDALHQFRIKHPMGTVDIHEIRPLLDVTDRQAEAVYKETDDGKILQKSTRTVKCINCGVLIDLEMDESSLKIDQLINKIQDLEDQLKLSRSNACMWEKNYEEVAEKVKEVARYCHIGLKEDADEED